MIWAFVSPSLPFLSLLWCSLLGRPPSIFILNYQGLEEDCCFPCSKSREAGCRLKEAALPLLGKRKAALEWILTA